MRGTKNLSYCAADGNALMFSLIYLVTLECPREGGVSEKGSRLVLAAASCEQGKHLVNKENMVKACSPNTPC